MTPATTTDFDPAELPPVDREMVARSRAAWQRGERGELLEDVIRRLGGEVKPVEATMTPATTTEATPAPAMPYRVEEHKFGADGHRRAVKRYANGGTALLTDDEVRVWEYARHLEARLAETEAELARVLATPPATADRPQKGKGGK